jgi:hypothetical protein
VLAIWSIYGADPNKIDIDFILNFAGLSTYMEANEDADQAASEALKRKADLLFEINFQHCDKLDESIINFIKQGYFDETQLFALINEFETRIAYNIKIEELRHAWRTFHYSYNDNEAEVIDNFLKASDRCLPHLDVSDISEICKIFFQLDHDDCAKNLVDSFIQYHYPLRTNFENPHFSSYPPYPYLLMKLEELKEKITPPKNILEILNKNSANREYNHEDILFIAKFSSTELFNILKSLTAPEISKVPSYLLSMGSIKSPGEPELQAAFETIFINTFEAVLKVRGESLLNKARTQTLMQHEARYREIIERRSSTDGP